MKSSYFKPSSFSTAALTPSMSLAIGKVSSPGCAEPCGSASRSRLAARWLTVLPARRSSRGNAYLERVREDRHNLVTKPGPGWLAQVHPQVVVTESAGQSLKFGKSAVDSPKSPTGRDRDVGDARRR